MSYYPVKNLGEIDDENMGYENLPIGDYQAKVVNVTNTTSKEKETPGINFEFVVTDGNFTKRKLWHTCWLRGSDEDKTKKMLGMFKGFLRDLGFTKPERDALALPIDIMILFKKLENAKVLLSVGVKEYNGKVSNEITSLENLEDAPF